MNSDFIDSSILSFIVSKITISSFSHCEFSHYIGFFFIFMTGIFIPKIDFKIILNTFYVTSDFPGLRDADGECSCRV